MTIDYSTNKGNNDRRKRLAMSERFAQLVKPGVTRMMPVATNTQSLPLGPSLNILLDAEYPQTKVMSEGGRGAFQASREHSTPVSLT